MDNTVRKGFGRIYAFSKDGIPVDGFPFDELLGSTDLHTPAFADINCDDTLDMGLITDRTVAIGSEIYYTYLFKLPGAVYNPSTLLWPQYGHDDYNSNNTDFRISYKVGDPNADNKVNLADLIYLVNFFYRKKMQPNPLWNSDVNCDGKVDYADILYLVNYFFKKGPAICQ